MTAAVPQTSEAPSALPASSKDQRVIATLLPSHAIRNPVAKKATAGIARTMVMAVARDVSDPTH